MKTLNSFGVSRTTQIGMSVLVIAAILFLMSPLSVFAAGTTVAVNVSSSQINSGQPITISGTVSPAPSSGSAVTVSTANPNGQVVDISPVTVNSGSFSYTYTTGGSSNWVNGTYTVTVTYKDNSGVVTTGTQTFKVGTTSGTTSNTGSSGSVTTVFYNVTTTVSAQTTVTQQVQTTVTQQIQTTVVQQNTVTQQQQTTVTQQMQTTVFQAYTGSDTGTYVGAAGVVIAIVAGALAALALRKK